MTSFTLLPPEILLIIFRYLPVEDKDILNELSRHIRRVAKPIIEEHQSLKRQYAIQECSCDESRGQTIASLLLRLVRDRSIASYVTTLRLDDWVDDWESSSDPYRWNSSDEMLVRNSALQMMPSIFWEGSDSDLADGNEGQYLVLLLCLLPGLTELEILEERYNGKPSFHLLRLVLEQDMKGVFLRGLRRVRLECINKLGDGDSSDLDTILELSKLPSIDSIYIQQMRHSDETYENCEASGVVPTRSQSSRLTELAFLDSDIGSKAMYDFLGNFSSLQSFTSYSLDTEVTGDCFWFCRALQVHAKSTLRKLVLVDLNYDTGFVGSLRGLEALSYLEVVDNMIVTNDWGSASGIRVVLPASLEILRLHCSRWDQESYTAKIVESIIAPKDHYNPRLNRVTAITPLDERKFQDFGDPILAFEGLGQACTAAGIELSMEEIDRENVQQKIRDEAALRRGRRGAGSEG